MTDDSCGPGNEAVASEPQQLTLPFEAPATPATAMVRVEVQPLGPFVHYFPAGLSSEEIIRLTATLTQWKYTTKVVEVAPVEERA